MSPIIGGCIVFGVNPEGIPMTEHDISIRLVVFSQIGMDISFGHDKE